MQFGSQQKSLFSLPNRDILGLMLLRKQYSDENDLEGLAVLISNYEELNTCSDIELMDWVMGHKKKTKEGNLIRANFETHRILSVKELDEQQ